MSFILTNSNVVFSDAAQVELWRWEDPDLGPRKIPNCNTPLQGRVQLAKTDVLTVNLETKTISVQSNGKSVQLGDSVTYVVVECK